MSLQLVYDWMSVYTHKDEEIEQEEKILDEFHSSRHHCCQSVDIQLQLQAGLMTTHSLPAGTAISH